MFASLAFNSRFNRASSSKPTSAPVSRCSHSLVPTAFFDPQAIENPPIFVASRDGVYEVLLLGFDQFPLDGCPAIELRTLSGPMFLKGFVDSDLDHLFGQGLFERLEHDLIKHGLFNEERIFAD
jgi:hypothetical protein